MKKILLSSTLVAAGAMLAFAASAGTAAADTVNANVSASASAHVGDSIGAKLLDKVNASSNIGTDGDHKDNEGKIKMSGELRASSTANVNGSKTVAQADTEIAKRITSLTALSTKIQQMKNVSASEKASVSAEVQTQIGVLTNLKAKIDADTDQATLKADMKSITDSYRIYLLVIPQGALLAAADRLNTIAGDVAAISAKLQVRIAAAQAAGKDTAALTASVNDMNAKSADAKVQATAVVNGVSGLTPDNGDNAKQASNKAALVAARANVKTGTSDLKAARQDIENVLKALKGFNLKVTASSTTSV